MQSEWGLSLPKYPPAIWKDAWRFIWRLPTDSPHSHSIYLRVIFTARFHTWFRQQLLREIATFCLEPLIRILCNWLRNTAVEHNQNKRRLFWLFSGAFKSWQFPLRTVHCKKTSNIESIDRISYLSQCKQPSWQYDEWLFTKWIPRDLFCALWFCSHRNTLRVFAGRERLHYACSPQTRKMIPQKVEWEVPLRAESYDRRKRNMRWMHKEWFMPPGWTSIDTQLSVNVNLVK